MEVKKDVGQEVAIVTVEEGGDHRGPYVPESQFVLKPGWEKCILTIPVFSDVNS